jgi:hypothetical protein
MNGTPLTDGFTTEVELIDSERLRVTVRGTVPAFFSGLIGRDYLPVEVTTTATRGSDAFVEIALVLDNTWSMSASGGTTTKIAGLKSAATTLVNEVMTRDDGKVRVSIIPYADYVNVGTGNRSASWLNVPADYSTTSTPAPRVCTQVPVTTTTWASGPSRCSSTSVIDSSASAVVPAASPTVAPGSPNGSDWPRWTNSVLP